MIKTLVVHSSGQGLHEFTSLVGKIVHEGGMDEGLCTLFIQHTSASLIIQENADPSARSDLERWMNRLVKEGDPLYTHTVEGPGKGFTFGNIAITGVVGRSSSI